MPIHRRHALPGPAQTSQPLPHGVQPFSRAVEIDDESQQLGRNFMQWGQSAERGFVMFGAHDERFIMQVG